ncbi:armadillo-type protein [Mycena latifolia]|nr:armadillo-type protein [Mycena latifolia]
MLENGKGTVRKAGLDIIVALVGNGELAHSLEGHSASLQTGSECAAIFIPEIIDKMFAMFGDQNKDVQRAAVKAVVVLTHDASVRDKLLLAGNSKAILKMLEDYSGLLRMSALNAIAALVENRSQGAALFIPEIIDKIFAMLGDEDPNRQTAAVKLVVAISRSDVSVRENLLTAGSSKGILKMLEDSNWRIRLSTLNVIAGLVENGSECAAFFIPETIDKIFMTLEDKDYNVLKAAVKLVVVSSQDASVREKLLTAGNIKRVLKMLDNGYWRVRNTGLHLITGLVKNGSECAAIFIPETIDKIFAMVADEDKDVRATGVKLVVAFALNIPHGISTPETIQKIIRLLRHEHPAVKHIALSTLDTLASLESFRFFVSTPQNLVHILQALTGNWDDQIISCIGRIISFGLNISFPAFLS